MKKGLGLQANISDFNTTLPQTKHLNFFMGTNPVRYANGGAVRKGVPSSNMNVTQGFLPMALGFDNGGDVSFYNLVTRVIGNYLAKQSGKSPDDPEIKVAAENLQQTNPDAVRIIFENEYGSGVSAGAYDSGFPIGGAQNKEPPLPTETVETDIGEMRIPENFPDEPSIVDKSKGIIDNVINFGTDLGSNLKEQFFPPLTKEEIGAGLDTLLKENEAKNQPKKEEKKEEKKMITAEPDETDKPVDSGISSLQGQTKKGGGPELTKKQQEDLQKTLKSSTGNEGKKDVPSWALPLMSAGFAMMASKSPYFLQALGEAGQEGIKTLTAQKQAEQDRLDAQADRDLAEAQAAYYRGEGRQTSSTPMIIGGKYFVRKGDKLEPLLIDGKQANAQITRTEAIEILQKSNPAFVQMDPTEQNRQIDALIQLYNNSDALVNAQVPETKDGGFEILPFIGNFIKEFV